MKIKYLKLKNWLLVSLMGMLGFTACKSSKQATAEPRDTERTEQSKATTAKANPTGED